MNKHCILCETEKNLIVRNAYYHGIEKDSGIDLDVRIGVMICVPCYNKLLTPRDEQIQILARVLNAAKWFLKFGLLEGKRGKKK